MRSYFKYLVCFYKIEQFYLKSKTTYFFAPLGATRIGKLTVFVTHNFQLKKERSLTTLSYCRQIFLQK